jgi:hypothetical protein
MPALYEIEAEYGEIYSAVVVILLSAELFF